MVCEQVSHDPPTTAFHVASKGVALNGHIGQTSRMAGTALVCEQTGCGLITTEHEQYLFSHPSLAVRGIWYAAPFIELMGTMYIQASFGYYACIEFSSRGWISGEINHFKCLVNKNEGSVKDVLYKIEGQWTGQSTLIDYQKRTSSLFFNVESLVPSEPVVRSIQTMGPLESRRVWHKVAEAIRTSQPVLANKEKAAIEQNQREAEKKREEQGQPWQPAYFKWQAQEPHVVQLQAMWHDTLQKKTDPVLEGNWVMLK
ncbi:uncharacterized protein B0P05DRAFT_562813 [Gilbertella persicaria]|uniref:uncharacterized protein n=1 Tax=Gilbertella persicaria TaxID=101096 RepID=UPI00221ED438|nr:uncharacterized protein B0P05DRAFT_562813 [Gilbertella persicaria]KAI8051063.1 hypothetical protein B0P05DRAFT_562813 [Gilbertella persicaria]